MSEHDEGQPPARLGRPEWMLAPPPSASIGDMLRNDPRAALKSRGFSQAGSQRVQKSGGGGHRATEDATLWTETPSERAERLRDEEMGVRRRATAMDDAGSSAAYAKNDAELAREDRIRAAVEKHKATRGPSLLEQHQEKRRTEMRKRETGPSGSDSEEEDRRRRRERRRKERRRREEEGDGGERRRDKRTRSRSVSPSGSDRSSTRRERHHRYRSRRDEDSDRRRGDEKESRHRYHHRRRSRSRSPERDERRAEKERRREKEKRRKKREEEERGEKKGAPMMVWDREAALSVGGRLMDERKRLDVIKSSSSLNERFGTGTSRYM